MLRVTRVSSCSNAVAASMVSITGGDCPVARFVAPLIVPHRRTTASLTDNRRPANRLSNAASAASTRGRRVLSSGRLDRPFSYSPRTRMLRYSRLSS